jgi:microcystin-dependent protein
MRELSKVIALKNLVRAENLRTSPPGYVNGCRLQKSEDGTTVIVQPGVVEVAGIQIINPSEHLVVDTDFTSPRANSVTYYLYLTKDRVFKADLLAPMFSSTYYCLMHPYAAWRSLGYFVLDEYGQVVYLVSVEEIDTSVILVRDQLGLFTAENLEAVLAELGGLGAQLEEDLEDLAGEGRTTETVKDNADDIGNLAGAGRTTETVKQNADAITAKGVPTGATMMWWAATPPTGWLICDGSSQLIADYAALSAVIRDTFGGADGTHFYLPNPQGLSPTGVGAQDINARTKTGPALGEVREDKMQGHWHTVERGATSGGGKSYCATSGSSGRDPIETGGSIESSWAFGATTIGSDTVNGPPRPGAYTHGPEIGVHFIIKT